MNILYINHYAGSIHHGMEFRPYYLAREWVRSGHRVRIIGADFSHLRTVNPVVTNDFEIENIDGIEYQWVKAGDYEGNGIARALTMVRFVGKLWLRAKKISEDFHPDIVISSSTYPLDTFAAQKIAGISGAKYIHEGHDLWPLTLVELGGMSRYHPFCQLLGLAERSAYRNADRVVSILPNTLPYLFQHGFSEKQSFVYVPNGIVAEDWREVKELMGNVANIFHKLHSKRNFIVCYLGGHAVSNALDTFIDAGALVKETERFAFVLVGKGIEKERLMNKAKMLGADNVYFLPPVQKEQVPSVLMEADALYVGARPCSLYRYGVSMNKMYDYMMAGKPVISGVEAANDDVSEAGCGIKVEAGSAEAIVEAVKRLADMTEDERLQMGEDGRKWVLKNAEYHELAQKFLNGLEFDER